MTAQNGRFEVWVHIVPTCSQYIKGRTLLQQVCLHVPVRAPWDVPIHVQ